MKTMCTAKILRKRTTFIHAGSILHYPLDTGLETGTTNLWVAKVREA